MSRQPPPLMDLNERPQQFLYVVPDIPQKPDELEFPLGYPGVDGIPKKMPRGRKFPFANRVGLVAHEQRYP